MYNQAKTIETTTKSGTPLTLAWNGFDSIRVKIQGHELLLLGKTSNGYKASFIGGQKKGEVAEILIDHKIVHDLKGEFQNNEKIIRCSVCGKKFRESEIRYTMCVDCERDI